MQTDAGLLRLRRRDVTCDLVAMMRQAGWRIVSADDRDGAVLEQFGIWNGRVR